VTQAIDTKRVLARNTAWNYVGFAINLAANLLVFPFVVHRIGDSATGVWLLLSAITGYMGLLELGIVPSLTQAIAASLARGERGAVSRVASSAQAVLAAVGIIALALLPASAAAIRFLGVSAAIQNDALFALRLTIVGFALRMPLAAFQAILLGCQRQDRCNQLWIVIALAKALGAVIVLGTGHGLVGLVSTELTIHLLAGGLQYKWVRQELPDLRLSWRLVSRPDAGRLLSFGSAMLAVSMCSLIIDQTDRVVIATSLPVEMVTYYAAAWKIYMLAYSLTTTFVQAVSPVAGDLFGRDDRVGLRRLFLRSTKFTTLIAWPFVMTLGFSGGFLLKVWMGPRFVGSLAVAQVLMVAFAVTAYNHAGYAVLTGTRRVGPTVLRYFLPQAVLNLVLSVWLVRRIGNVGVALGTTLPALALEYVFLRFVLRELQVSWREVFRKVVAPVAGPAFLSFLPLAFAYTRLDASSPVLFVTAVPCVLLYAAVAWYFLSVDERTELLGYVPAFVRRRLISVTAPRGYRTLERSGHEYRA
jgi:O-antigen/teichoic acid export membrane protein